ncbi:MAG: hypothetical protein HY835_06005 [Anaerolineae bacterium]|nr:hypothetical protein [Anaerolineae bacterium]
MTEKSRSLTLPGVFQSIGDRARLVLRLMGDSRVNFLLKLLPIGSVVYLVIPTDILPIIPVDDAAVLWLGSYLFVEMCPQDVVQEHWDAIQRAKNVFDAEATPPKTAGPSSTADVVDGEFTEVDSKP